MLSYLILALLFLLVITLLFWQFSNIRSIMLGAPAISSPRNDLWKSLADKRKTILDLGCGNGSLCLKMAPHFKHVYGIEYSPFYYIVAKLRTSQRKNITIKYGNMMTMEWPPTNVIYCYLLPPVMEQLKSRLNEARESGTTVVSFGFAIPRWKPSNIKMDQRKQRLFIYGGHGLEKSAK